MRRKFLVALIPAILIAQAWFYSLPGRAAFSLWIPFIVTILYALISRSYLLAFLVGFLSFMTFPVGVFWFYYVRGSIQFLDLEGWLASSAWSFLFGLIGLSTAKISRSVSTRSDWERHARSDLLLGILRGRGKAKAEKEDARKVAEPR